jgi:protoheme IX farnesyltransferase
MKRVSSFNIIPGAIAGSLPVVIGCTAATGTITQSAFLLFVIQFVWQFPHTWSIGWMLNDDYSKAGIKMLPPTGGLNRPMAILLLFSTFLIIPAGLLLYMYHFAGIVVSTLFTLAGLWVTFIAYRHYNTGTRKSALRLMLGLVAYLPFILLILVLERFF